MLHLLRADCPLPAGAHVVIYVRDSGHEAQDRSVSQQVEAAREYAQAHGLIVDGVYADEARVSTNTDKRDELLRLLGDIHARYPKIGDKARRDKASVSRPFGVLFYSSSRLGRDEIEAMYNRLDLETRAITVIDLTETSTGVPLADNILRIVKAHHDALVLQDISNGSKRGLAQLVSLRDDDPEFLAHNPDWTPTGAYVGIHPATPPRGFRVERLTVGTNKRTNTPRVVQRIVPDYGGEWERAVLAWQMRLRGEPIGIIHDATRLYKTTNGYSTFYRNPIYCGDFHYGGAILRDFVPAIVSRDEFAAEQARATERARKLRGEHIGTLEPRRARGDFLLSGILWCGHVDGKLHPMHGSTNGRGWRHYLCSRAKSTRGGECSAPTIAAKRLDKAVVDYLCTHVYTPTAILDNAQSFAAAMSTRSVELQREIAAHYARLHECEAAITRLVSAIEKLPESSALVGQLATRESERKHLQDVIGSLELEAQRTENAPALSASEAFTFAQSVREDLEAGGEIARQVIRQLIGKVIVAHNEVIIEYRSVGISDMLHTQDTTFPTFSTQFYARLHRRRMSADERDLLAARVRLAREQGARLHVIAARFGVNRQTVANLLAR